MLEELSIVRLASALARHSTARHRVIAENVANAASEGGFLGFGGERVCEDEEKAIAAVRKALKG